MKKLLTLFAAGALLLGLASCGKSEAKKLRVGVSIPAADHGWTGGIVWSAEDAKKRLEAANPDLEIVISTARDAAEQVSRIENLMVRNVNALVVLPQEPGAADQRLRSRQKTGHLSGHRGPRPRPSRCRM